MLNFILEKIYNFLSFVFIKKDNRYCFISYPDCSDNSYAMFLHYLKSRGGEIDYVWLVKDEVFSNQKINDDIERFKINSKCKVVSKNSILGLYYFLTSRVIFFTHGAYWFVKSSHRQVIVNLWHGMPLKKIGLLDNKNQNEIPFSQYAIATSFYFKKIISKSMGLPEENVWLTGQPRNDCLFDNSISNEDVIDGYKFEKIILWMPTYRKSFVGDIREDSSQIDYCLPLLTEEKIEFFNSILKKANTLCVIKLHPMDVLNFVKFGSFSNIVIINSEYLENKYVDTYSLLKKADCLITDYSSVFFDYILLNRSMGFTVHDIGKYSRGFVFEGNVLDILPGKKITNFDDLCGFVLGKGEEISVENKKIFNEFYDGLSCQRVSEEVARAISILNNKNDRGFNL